MWEDFKHEPRYGSGIRRMCTTKGPQVLLDVGSPTDLSDLLNELNLQLHGNIHDQFNEHI